MSENTDRNNQENEFKDIPILDSKEKEKLGGISLKLGGKKRSEGDDSAHLSAFAAMLKDDAEHFKSAPPAQAGQDEPETDPVMETPEAEAHEAKDAHQEVRSENVVPPTNILSPEFLREERVKWENSVRGKKNEDPGKKKKIILFAAIGALLLAGASVFVLVMEFASPPPPPPPPPAAPAPKKPAEARPKEPEKTPEPQQDKAAQPPPAPQAEQPKAEEKTDKPEGGKPQEPKEEKQEEAPGPAAPPKAEEKTKDDTTLLAEKMRSSKSESDKAGLARDIEAFVSDKKPDLKTQMELARTAQSAGAAETALAAYKKLLSQKADSPEQNFVAGVLSGNDPAGAAFLKKAYDLSPDKMRDAAFELAELHWMNREFSKAADTCKQVAAKFADDEKAWTLLAKYLVFDGKAEEGVEGLRKFLKSRGESEKAIALKLLPIAQLMPKTSTAGSLLEELGKVDGASEDLSYLATRQKALRGKLAAADFRGWYHKSIKEFHIIYLLGADKETSVLLLPTAPDDFPDFWKVFIAWKNNDDFEENARKLIEKSRTCRDKTRAVAASMWLDETKPEDAEKNIRDIEPGNEPLLYFVISEIHRKNGNIVEAEKFLRRALAVKPNMYVQLIKSRLSKTSKDTGDE